MKYSINTSFVAVALIQFTGCCCVNPFGAGRFQQAIDQAIVDAKTDQVKNDLLKQFAQAYMDYHDANGAGPTDWSDFDLDRDNDMRWVTAQMMDEEYVVAWGIALKDVTIKKSDFVLAYPLAARQSSGKVVMLDGTVKEMGGAGLNMALRDQDKITIQAITRIQQTKGEQWTPPNPVQTPIGVDQGFHPPDTHSSGNSGGATGGSRLGQTNPNSTPVTASTSLSAGAKVWIEWNGKWYQGVVVSTHGDGKVTIHYDGWSDDWNEAVTRNRLQLR